MRSLRSICSLFVCLYFTGGSYALAADQYSIVFKATDNSLVEALNLYSSTLAFGSTSYFKWFRVAPSRIAGNETDTVFSDKENAAEQGMTTLAAVDQYFALAASRYKDAVQNGSKNALAAAWFFAPVGSSDLGDAQRDILANSTSMGLLGPLLRLVNPFSPVQVQEIDPRSQVIRVASRQYSQGLQQAIFSKLSQYTSRLAQSFNSAKRASGGGQASFDLTNTSDWSTLRDLSIPIFAGGEMLIGPKLDSSLASIKLIYPAIGMPTVNDSRLILTPFQQEVRSLATSFFQIERIAYGALFADNPQGATVLAKFEKSLGNPRHLKLSMSFGNLVSGSGSELIDVSSIDPALGLKIIGHPDFKFGSTSLLSALGGQNVSDSLLVQINFHKMVIDMDRPDKKLTERSRFSWTLNTHESLVSYTICSRIPLISAIVHTLPEFQDSTDTGECEAMGMSPGPVTVFQLKADSGGGISKFLNNVALKQSFDKLSGNMEDMFSRDLGTALAVAVQKGRQVRGMVYDELKNIGKR